MSKPITPAQVDAIAKLRAKQADELTRFEADQHNARVAFEERQRAEAEALRATFKPLVPAAPAAVSKPKRSKQP